MDIKVIFDRLRIAIKNIWFIYILVIILVALWLVNAYVNADKLLIQTDLWEWYSSYEPSIWSENINLLPKWVKKSEPSPFIYLFSEFDIGSYVIWEKIKTIFTQNNWLNKYLVVYEIWWWIDTYLAIKNTIKNQYWLSKNINEPWLNEINNIWIYSFYYNNKERPNTVYLVAYMMWKIWWFEYPRDKHEELKQFIKSLDTNN